MGMGIDGSAIAQRAEASMIQSLNEDRKLAGSCKSAAAGKQVDRAKQHVAKTREEANENLQAAKDKTDGSFLGLKLGGLALAIGIGLCFFFPVATVMMVTMAVVGGAMAYGNAKGSRDAEDNEAKAAVAKEEAGQHDVMAKEFEKKYQDYNDGMKQIDAAATAIRDGARKRQSDEMKQGEQKVG